MAQFLLADDHIIFRQGLMLLLTDWFPDVQWHQASNWYETQQILLQTHINLALLDLHMPGNHPWPNEIKRLSSQFPDLPICVLSATTTPEVIQTAFSLGIKGYIPKLADAKEVQHAISAVSSGKSYIPVKFWETAQSRNVFDKTVLTQRQQSIMQMLAQGNSNKQIGAELQLTESTVKRHIYNIFQALGVKNRVEAITTARQRGLIP